MQISRDVAPVKHVARFETRAGISQPGLVSVAANFTVKPSVTREPSRTPFVSPQNRA